ncbi:MAG TPA: zinc-dependent metalloprotease [Chloroflexota bacterium]|nr:zinc-dependent metalloprotease [Chloroflexota bacterium]
MRNNTGYTRLLSRGLAIAAVAGLAWIATRRQTTEPTSMIDWNRVETLARRFARNEEVRIRPDDVANLTAKYSQMVHQSEDLITNYTGDRLPSPLTSIHVFDRDQWLEANIANFRLLFEPIEDLSRDLVGGAGMGPLLISSVNRLLLSGQLGVLLGYLSRRVLGQYDLALLGREPITTGRLYFVEPNIHRLERALRLDGEEFRLWIALHETTHAFEFEAHPWLRDHMNSLLVTYFGTLSKDLAGLRTDVGGVGGLVRRVGGNVGRTQYTLELVMSPEQREIFRSLQALMCLLEGYSNHIMDHVGRSMLRSYSTMKARFEERLRRKNLGERLFAKMTGLDVKLEQYVLGERFVNEVVRQRGIDFMNRVWQSPAYLPTLAEVRAPSTWIERVA